MAGNRSSSRSTDALGPADAGSSLAVHRAVSIPRRTSHNRKNVAGTAWLGSGHPCQRRASSRTAPVFVDDRACSGHDPGPPGSVGSAPHRGDNEADDRASSEARWSDAEGRVTLAPRRWSCTFNLKGAQHASPKKDARAVVRDDGCLSAVVRKRRQGRHSSQRCRLPAIRTDENGRAFPFGLLPRGPTRRRTRASR
jgi:hypothetical protein